jgi:erythromycin esterase
MHKTLLLPVLLLVLSCAGFAQESLKRNYADSSVIDLAFLKEFVGDKKIVCLGEEWHGTETFNQVKNRLVKYLHDELGFNLIVFESGVYGSFMANKSGLQGKDRLIETLPSIWRTESVLDLINYIDASKSSSSFTQMGVDIGGGYTNRFSNYLKTSIQPLSLQLADSAFLVDSTLQSSWINWQSSYKKTVLVSSEEKARIQGFYQKLIKFCAEHQVQFSLQEKEFKLLMLCLQSRIDQVEHISTQGSTIGLRDRAMARNLTTIVNEIYPDQKVIVWAAHLHISKSLNDTYKHKEKIESMVQMLPAEMQKEVVSIDLKPLESAPKPVKKMLQNSSGDTWFIDWSKDFRQLDLESLRNQFDAIIYCENEESINEYRISE